jgi:hypothetical protein
VDDVDAAAHRVEGGCFCAPALQSDDVEALLLQRLQIAELVRDAEVRAGRVAITVSRM